MLSLKQIKHVCYGDFSNPSDQCRYLEQDDLDHSKYYCLKLIKQKKHMIDTDVDDFIAKSKSKGNNPYFDAVPLGDNCAVYIKLKTVLQGFDVK